MIKNILSAITIITFLTNCGQSNCPQDINKLPLYGQVKKCAEQINADNNFLKNCDKTFENRAIASQHHVDMGWAYFYKNEGDSAILRFNQAWLLDSLNPNIYWGIGNVLGQNKKYKESIKYFEKSLKLDKENAKIWESASSSYSFIFSETNDQKYLDIAIDYLKTSIQLEPNNARAYGQLTAFYTVFSQKDSALKYLEITDQLDPKAINPNVRQHLNGL